MSTRTKSREGEDPPAKRPHWTVMLATLTVPVASIAAAYLASEFQKENTAITILNQREQSESNLRASMFKELINPIIGQQKSDQDIDPDRYRLLAELLLLNFHEHFEFKSLLLDVDRKLQDAERTAKPRRAARLEDGRRSLRSTARRVIDRQIAMLGDHSGKSCAGRSGDAPPSTVEFVLKRSDDGVPDESAAGAAAAQVQVPVMGEKGKSFTAPQSATSPDCRDKFEVAFENPDWKNGTIKVHVDREVHADKEVPEDKDRGAPPFEFITDFTLTQFDFPFTDNTLLADGNRFAMIIHDSDPDKKKMWVRLLWFPKDYFPPRERPTDFQQFRKYVPLLNRGSTGSN